MFRPLIEMWNRIRGGRSVGRKPSDFNQTELRMGIKVEMEHTTDRRIATEIAMDHLSENPHYYSKLRRCGLADEL